MAEDLKGLIEKINQEGVKAAEEKAQEIEAEAKRQAEGIIEKAKKEAEKIIAEAKDEAARMEKSGKASLAQAGRNLILSLRKEITSMLDGLVASRLREELSPSAIVKIINSLIKNYKGAAEGNVIVSLNKEDLQSLEKDFLADLKREVKKGITLKRADDIQAGFIISYDSGKSHFDFTDKGLAEYISLYLKPQLAELLKKVVDK